MSNKISEAYKILSKELYAQNIRFRLVPIERIKDLKKTFSHTLEHEIDCPEFVEFIKYINWFGALNSFPEAKSILVASVYNPAGKVVFQKQDKDIEVVIPQGFIKFYPKQRVLQTIITDILHSLGYRNERILLHIKLLAVQSGLAEYGKNNITYVEGFGSSHFLGSFITDMPANDDFWREPKIMDACENCDLCRLNCPTGAISEDRFLIHGEKCITLYNENPGEFPEWIESKWHHAVVGCMKCQSVCPCNAADYVDVPILETFTVSETDILLNETEFEQLPQALKDKFAQFGFPEIHSLLLRNIKVICM